MVLAGKLKSLVFHGICYRGALTPTKTDKV